MLFPRSKNYDRVQRTFVQRHAGQGSLLRAVQPKMLLPSSAKTGDFSNA
jgi:hypothetical protein